MTYTQIVCPACDGTGSVDNPEGETDFCSLCNGTGSLEVRAKEKSEPTPIREYALKRLAIDNEEPENVQDVLDGYKAFVSRMSAYPEDDIVTATMGLVCEASEFMDILHKYARNESAYRQGKISSPPDTINPDKARDELGDILFYVVLISGYLNTDLQELMMLNYRKLVKRHKNGSQFEIGRTESRDYRECESCDGTGSYTRSDGMTQVCMMCNGTGNHYVVGEMRD